MLAHIPEHVRNAFIAAEDKRFFQHKGIDERGGTAPTRRCARSGTALPARSPSLIRAFIGNLALLHRVAQLLR